MSILTRLEIQNVQGNTLALPLLDSSGGYIVKDIEGLDPVKATLTSAAMAQVDGAQPQSSRRDTRNITAKLGFAPNWATNDIRSLRANLYNYLLPKSSVLLNFFFDEVLYAKTQATVESFDNSMFSQDPEVALSLICYDPDFYAAASETIPGNTVTNTTTQTISYEGTSDTGFIFTLWPTAAGTGFTLYNTHPDNTAQVFNAPSLPYLAGDVITVNTIPGQKSITLKRSNVVTSVLYSVLPGSMWPTLAKGDNSFRCLFGTAGVPLTVKYTAKYAGL